MTISTWIPLSNNGTSPFVSYGGTGINCPIVAQINARVGPPIITGGSLIPIYPLPGNAGTGSLAISLFWTLPLVPLMAKLFLLSALGMR